MTNIRSDADLVREVAGMQRESITDTYALDLHTRHMHAAGRSEETIRARRGAITRLADFLDPYAETPRAVLDATSDQLVEWQASRGHLDEASIRAYVVHVQIYYRWLVRPMRIVIESPADDLIRPKVRRRQPRPIPENDLEFALDACTDSLIRTWVILGSYAGLRAHDMGALDRDDVLTDSTYPMLRVRGKGGNEDLVIVGHEVIRALLPYMGKRRGAMFTDEDGKRIRPKRISAEVNGYFQRIGLPYTCHQLRHRFGTRMYKLTRDLRYTQQQMRHSSTASTELYTEVPTDKAAKSIQALDDELAKRPRGRDRRDP